MPRSHAEPDSSGSVLDWVTIGSPDEEGSSEAPLRMRSVILQLLVGGLVVLVAVTVGGSLAAKRLAEREAVNDAAKTADVLAEAVVQPVLTDKLISGDAASMRAFDTLVRKRVIGDSVVHLKLWSPQGKVLYADEPQLIGRTFPLDASQLGVLKHPATKAEISDLDRSENSFETGDRLVEVYRPVWTPTNRTLLFEIYAPYVQVSQRTNQLWRGFAGLTLTSLLLFVVLLSPLLWHLLSRVRRSQRQRELLLERAVDASATERRRIAASLHDGPVQDLAATSFVVAGATAHAESTGQLSMAEELHQVSGSVRASIRALRSLLVDIYPASLAQAGLGAALNDLAQTVRAPGLEIHVDHDPAGELLLSPGEERLVYRVAQETLRNAAVHAAPCTVTLTLFHDEEAVVLDVVDDGHGFDVAAAMAEPQPGHFGLQLLADLASSGGAMLQVASAPGRGTHWRLQLPDVVRRADDRVEP